MNRSVLSLLAAATLLFSCKQAPKGGAPLFSVDVAEVLEKEIPYRLTFVGETASANTYTIQPRISGFLVKSYVSSGMPVKKGDLMFLIDPTQFSADYAAAKANLASSQAQLAQAQSNYNRTVPLARINAVSRSSLDQATAELLSAKESVKAQQSALENASLNLSYTKIYAPATGIATEIDPAVGDYVGVGTQFPVINKVLKVDTIAVALSLPISVYIEATGDSLIGHTYDNRNLLSDIVLHLPDGTVYPEKGFYDYTESQVNNQTNSLVIKVKFTNTALALKPGQFVRVSANVGPLKPSVLVPQQSVSQVQNISSVFTVDNGDTVRYRRVWYGKPYEEYFVIDSGLMAGERVLLNGRFKVREGMKINPVTAGENQTENVKQQSHEQ